MHAHPLHSLSIQKECESCEKKHKVVDAKMVEVRAAIRGLRESVARIRVASEERNENVVEEEERGRSRKRRGSVSE